MTVLAVKETLADLVRRIGDVPLDRILARPAPGTATSEDLVKLVDGEPKRLVELVDGVLVEKVVGNRESRFAVGLIFVIEKFLELHDLGFLTCGDGPHQLEGDVIRLPDVAFVPWSHLPPDADLNATSPNWTPALAVEVISPSNTRGEMQRKLRDYFAAGVELVWYVYQDKRVIHVYKSLHEYATLTDDDELDGGSVLPGFRVSVRELFDRPMRRGPLKQD